MDYTPFLSQDGNGTFCIDKPLPSSTAPRGGGGAEPEGGVDTIDGPEGYDEGGMAAIEEEEAAEEEEEEEDDNDDYEEEEESSEGAEEGAESEEEDEHRDMRVGGRDEVDFSIRRIGKKLTHKVTKTITKPAAMIKKKRKSSK